MITPNAIIAGVPKGGTTSLFKYLAAHPEVCASNVKETRYLIDIGYPLFNAKWNYHEHGIDGYKIFFDNQSCSDKKIWLEATPDYIYQNTPLSVLPDLNRIPKIIFVLRNPARRLFSFFQFAKNNMGALKTDISFAEYYTRLMNSKDKAFPDKVLLNSGFEQGKYNTYLKKWKQKIGDENIIIFIFEKFKEDPRRFMIQLSTELHINPSFYSSYEFIKHNVTYQVRNHRLNYLWKKVYSRIPIYFAKSRLDKVYQWLNMVPAKSGMTEADKAALLKLQEDFAPFNKDLEVEWGIDVSFWNFDG